MPDRRNLLKGMSLGAGSALLAPLLQRVRAATEDPASLPNRFVFVVRSNGAVSPCIFWNHDPLGFYPETSYEEMLGGGPLNAILDGLATGQPVGTCQSCTQRKEDLYVPLRRRLSRRLGSSESSASDLVQL